MTTRTKWMLRLGVVSAGFMTAVLSEMVVGREAAPLVGGVGMFTYWAFAFADSTRRAIWMTVTMVVIATGIGYVRFVRYDAVGGVVLVIAVLLALGLVLVGRRRLQVS